MFSRDSSERVDKKIVVTYFLTCEKIKVLHNHILYFHKRSATAVVVILCMYEYYIIILYHTE